MSARMQYPLSQRRHTNVAVVRYTRNGVRLEIACYKNKVMSYRAGTERRLDEVLQVERVFSNVARGHVASEKELIAVFGPGVSEHAALQHILVHGEVQVAQHERSVELEDVFKDVAMIIAQKCVHAQTQRPFPLPVIEQALRAMGAAVKMDQPAKKQALALMHQLMASQVLPLRRANMRLRCNTTTAAARALVEAWCVERGVEVLQRCGADDDTPSPQQQQQQEQEQEQQEQHVDDVDDDSNARNHAADDAAADDDDVHKDVAAPAPPLRHRVDATWSLLITAQPHLYRALDEFVKQHLPPGSTVHTVDAAVMELHNHSGGTNTAAVTAASLPSTSSEVDRDDVVGGGRHARTRSTTAATTSTSSLSRTDGTRAHDAQGGRGKTRKQQQQQKQQRQRQRRHGRKGNDSDSDDDEEHRADTTRATSSAAQLSAELRALSVASDDVDAEATATAVTGHVAQQQHSVDTKKNSKHNNNNNGDDDDDSDDDDDAHRRRRQKKGGGGRKKANKPSAQQQQQQQQQQPNSDDEIEGNRRQRKQAKKKEEDAQHHTDNVYNEDDEYACMYDDDDGSEVDAGDGDKNDAAREDDAADVVVATTTTTATDGTA